MSKVEPIKVYTSALLGDAGRWIKDRVRTQYIEKANVIVFGGGEDINPAMYREKSTRIRYNDNRDRIEANDYMYALKHKIPMFGICRGMQMLTVMEGGKLVYDMDHPYGHSMSTFDNHILYVNSLHHQLCNPYYGLEKDQYRVLGWAGHNQSLSDYYDDGLGHRDTKYPRSAKEPEMIWFPKSNALGVQWHPEMMSPTTGAVEYLNRIFKLFLDGDLEKYYIEHTTKREKHEGKSKEAKSNLDTSNVRDRISV